MLVSVLDEFDGWFCFRDWVLVAVLVGLRLVSLDFEWVLGVVDVGLERLDALLRMTLFLLG